MNGPSLDLTDPRWLAGLAALPLLLWFHARGLTGFPARQRRLSLAVRAAILGLVVLALAGLTLERSTDQPFVVFLIDRSDSAGEEATRTVEQFLDSAAAVRGDASAAFLPFAARPGDVSPDRTRAAAFPDTETRMGTDIAAAIEAAAAAVPPGYAPRLVLLSDGNQTDGDARSAALQAGIPIDVVPLPVRDAPEVQISEIVVPAQVHEGEPFSVEVVVNSNVDAEGVLRLLCDRQVVAGEQRRKIAKGENRFKYMHRLKEGGLARFQAHVQVPEDKDTNRDNNIAHGLVRCDGQPRVLIVAHDTRQAEHLANALREEKIRVDPPVPPEGLPDSPTKFQNYDLIVLSNLPLTHPAVTAKKLQMLKEYVRERGGGLLVIGGGQSFGPGGYARSPLEDLLPVHCDFAKDKEKPGLAMVLVIDKSGSMADASKMDMAREAARSAVELLGPKDQVGVIAFDDQFQWVSELAPVIDRTQVAQRINGIEAKGGTSILPPMLAAFDALTGLGAAAKFKHIIVLTDGQDEAGNQPQWFFDLAERAAGARVTISTVGVGPDADKELLKEIARRGRGNSYFAEDAAQVPQIFAKETMDAGKRAIQQGEFHPVPYLSTPVLGGIDFSETPLDGYVLTRIRPTAEQALVTERFDPLLVWWRQGLGMCTAFTSDAGGEWSDRWNRESPDRFSKFWAQVARQTMRKQDASGAEVKIVRNGKRSTVFLDAVDGLGDFLNDGAVELAVTDRWDNKRTLAMRQSAPGRYEAAFDTPPEGEYLLRVALSRDSQPVFHLVSGLAVGYPAELRVRPVDEDLLRSIAADSCGRYQPEPEAVFRPGERPAPVRQALWPILLQAALVLFVIDVALRRVALPGRPEADRPA